MRKFGWVAGAVALALVGGAAQAQPAQRQDEAYTALIKQHLVDPRFTTELVDHMPASVEMGFRVFGGNDPQPLSRSDRAALYSTAILTLLACAGTVVPLYLLARVALSAPAAWAAAALWPLAPAANLFQPVADTAYPFLSTTALALAALVLLSCSTARAGVHIGIGIGWPGWGPRHCHYYPGGLRIGVALPPVYVGAPAVYAAPAPVYVAPAPTVIQVPVATPPVPVTLAPAPR